MKYWFAPITQPRLAERTQRRPRHITAVKMQSGIFPLHNSLAIGDCEHIFFLNARTTQAILTHTVSLKIETVRKSCRDAPCQ